MSTCQDEIDYNLTSGEIKEAPIFLQAHNSVECEKKRSVQRLRTGMAQLIAAYISKCACVHRITARVVSNKNVSLWSLHGSSK